MHTQKQPTREKNLPMAIHGNCKQSQEEELLLQKEEETWPTWGCQKVQEPHLWNSVVSMLHKNKAKFFEKLDPSESKSFWKTVKFLNKKSSSIPSLMKDAHNWRRWKQSLAAKWMFFQKLYHPWITSRHQWILNLRWRKVPWWPTLYWGRSVWSHLQHWPQKI